MTTNFERSKPRWRSSSGSTPRPMEPKPIMTIGPANSACRMWPSAVRVKAFMSVVPMLEWISSRRARREGNFTPGEAGNECGEVRLRLMPSGRADEPLASASAPGTNSRAEQPVALVGPGQPQRAGRLRPRSRSGCSTARRRPAARPRGRACRPRAGSGASAPRRRRGPARSQATAIGPSSKAGCFGPAVTSHSRTVPMTRSLSTATNDSPSAGSRPSRSRCAVLAKRHSPNASSSSASRAAISWESRDGS